MRITITYIYFLIRWGENVFDKKRMLDSFSQTHTEHRKTCNIFSRVGLKRFLNRKF